MTLGGVINLDQYKPQLSDGLFDILLIKKPKKSKELRNILSSLRKQDYNSPNFLHRKSAVIEIQSKQEIDWNIDGEKAGTIKSLSIRNINKGLTVIV